MHSERSKLDSKKRYLQVALNSTLEDAHDIIQQLPVSDRIIFEAGTPLIKRYGQEAITKIRLWCEQRMGIGAAYNTSKSIFSQGENLKLGNILQMMLVPSLVQLQKSRIIHPQEVGLIPGTTPYIVADLKTMDRGEAEVDIAWRGGASAAIALGNAPVETLDLFIHECSKKGLDSMVDMMNVDYPLGVLQKLKNIPTVVILHRGVDEERYNKEKQIPLYEIRRIKSRYNIMISIAGGDTLREVQSSIFNDTDIVVVWKSVFQSTQETVDIVEGFLKAIK